MFQELFKASTMLHLPVIAMVLFLMTFVAVVARAWWAGSRDPSMERLAALPLEDEPSAITPDSRG